MKKTKRSIAPFHTHFSTFVFVHKGSCFSAIHINQTTHVEHISADAEGRGKDDCESP